MIADSSKKCFEGVLVYQLDRFARNRYDSVTHKRTLKKNGVRVFSARENISEDASGILMEAIIEGYAEHYSVELSQKVKRGMNINATKCLYNGGIVPLGFIIDNNKQFQVDEERAFIVKKVFEMYSTGATMVNIIKYLNSNGIKSSKNEEFKKDSITRMLKNEKYIGTYSFGNVKIKSGIPSIISEDLFEKVQLIMKKNKCAPARSKAKIEYILTTKLFCGYCKDMMTGVSGTSSTNKVYNYYTCNNYKKKICNKKNVKKEYIEDLVVNETRKLLTDENINKISKELIKLVEKEKDTSNLKRLNKLLKDNEKQKNNLIDSLKVCDIESIRKTIFEEISKMDAKHSDIEKEILLEEKQNISLTISQVKFFLNQMRKGDINNIENRKLLINVFINRIYLYDDRLTLIFNTQDDDVEITQSLLNDIDSSFISKVGAPNRNLYVFKYKFLFFYKIFEKKTKYDIIST
jgi:DNA invertase Pin-like site-specific DNA recombinase